MGYRAVQHAYRYALEPTALVYQQTLIDTHISTDVRCMPIGTARLTSGSELYPNVDLDLARVDWREWPMNWYLELASNV